MLWQWQQNFSVFHNGPTTAIVSSVANCKLMITPFLLS